MLARNTGGRQAGLKRVWPPHGPGSERDTQPPPPWTGPRPRARGGSVIPTPTEGPGPWGGGDGEVPAWGCPCPQQPAAHVLLPQGGLRSQVPGGAERAGEAGQAARVSGGRAAQSAWAPGRGLPRAWPPGLGWGSGEALGVRYRYPPLPDRGACSSSRGLLHLRPSPSTPHPGRSLPFLSRSHQREGLGQQGPFGEGAPVLTTPGAALSSRSTTAQCSCPPWPTRWPRAAPTGVSVSVPTSPGGPWGRWAQGTHCQPAGLEAEDLGLCCVLSSRPLLPTCPGRGRPAL